MSFMDGPIEKSEKNDEKTYLNAHPQFYIQFLN